MLRDGAAAGVWGGWGVVGFGFFGGGFGVGFGGDGAVGLDGFGEGVFKLVDAEAGDGGDFEEGEFAAAGVGAEFFEFVGIGDVGLGGDDDGGFGGKGGVEGGELGGDGFEVGDGVSAPIRRRIGGPGVAG